MSLHTIDDLKKAVVLKDLPSDQIDWIYKHTEYLEYADGDLIMKYGEPVDYMWFLVGGKADFYMNVNGRLIHYFTFENDTITGGVGGILPYSRMKTSPGNNYAIGTVKVFRMHKDLFPQLENISPELVQRLVSYMTERARTFATHKMQNEKVTALGQLAAGIAHELNNPAAAISRIATELSKRIVENYELTEKLLNHNIEPQTIATIKNIIDQAFTKKESETISMMQRIENEDALADWLEINGVSDFREKAEIFNDERLDVTDLEKLKNSKDDPAFLSLLSWLENLLISQKVIHDLGEASNHISTLVLAIKNHVHMDRTHEKQPTQIHKDIDNALTLFGFKLRDKNIKVTKDYCTDMKAINAYIGELNQVWSNIIDNAIFAMEKNGLLTITTTCADHEVTIQITDNGSGIPSEIQSRIFDPFFTTKKIGEGTGIGLNLAMTVVKHHDGDIKLESQPGRTRFTITLPLDQKTEIHHNTTEIS